MQDLTGTVFTGDNLDIMREMNSESVDLIYLDPPFNSNKNYSAPIGSKAAGAAFKDTWTLSERDLEWHGEIAETNQALYEFISASKYSADEHMMSYLIMMSVRLIEMKRILSNEGSIYLHCDPTASHYLKVIMDSIFGRENFKNEIIWGYEKPRSASRKWRMNHDTILFYVKNDKADYPFNVQRVPKLDGTFEMRKPFKRPDGSVWTPKAKGKQAGSWWYDIASFATRMSAKERTGYPTQKPLALLKRIIKASSNEDYIVFDPFCGCATALVAAQLEARRWIGIDISAKAVELLQQRFKQHEDDIGFKKNFIATTIIPQRTDKEQKEKERRQILEQNRESDNLPHYRTHKPKLYGNQRGNCNGCMRHYEFKDFEVDHIKPKSAGGKDNYENLQLLCSSCNRIKGDASQQVLELKLQRFGILR